MRKLFISLKKLPASSKSLINRYKGLTKRKKLGVLFALILSLAAITVVPVLAWFSSQRNLGDLQYVDSPTKLYITAPEGEEIKYLDLSDIQVSKTDATSRYYVFSVTGSNALAYNLQLAYTTNNQFEYFIYPAERHEGTLPDNTEEPCPTYITHNDDGTGTNYYYTIDKSIVTDQTGAAVSSSLPITSFRIQNGMYITRQGDTNRIESGFLNLDTEKYAGNQLKATNDQHTQTYSYDRLNVQDCVEPLYWQAKNIKSDMNPTTRDLTDHYILEVNWSKAKLKMGDQFNDNGETDIIYISVESTSA